MHQLQTQVLIGSEGIKTAYKLMFEEKQLSILCLSSDYQQVIGDFFDQEISPQLYGVKQTREILPDLPTNRAFARTKNPTQNQVRFTELTYPSESDLVIGDNLALLISFSADQPQAIVLADKNLISNLQLQFELAWKSARR